MALSGYLPLASTVAAERSAGNAQVSHKTQHAGDLKPPQQKIECGPFAVGLRYWHNSFLRHVRSAVAAFEPVSGMHRSTRNLRRLI